MNKKMTAAGKAWVITDSNGVLIDNIDTDMIFHNMHLHILEVPEMAEHAFGNLEGWEDFPSQCGNGDVLIVGKNFGAGSSRQQAVDCFKALGISVIIAESFGAIYKRNAINSGMAIMEAPGMGEWKELHSGDKTKVDFQSGIMQVGDKNYDIKPMTGIQKEIYEAGDLFAYGKKLALGTAQK